MPRHVVPAEPKIYHLTPGRAALVGLLDNYLRGLLDPWVTLLEAHKLMYLMQVAGEPLRLRFVKQPYGPYAADLRHVLLAIEGHMISGYGDGGDRPDKILELVPGAADEARAFLSTQPNTEARFNRVARLVAGFESSFGLELLTTVHWVVTREGAASLEDVVSNTYAWHDRKREFSRRQIGLALNRLSDQGWLEGAEDPAPAPPAGG